MPNVVRRSPNVTPLNHGHPPSLMTRRFIKIAVTLWRIGGTCAQRILEIWVYVRIRRLAFVTRLAYVVFVRGSSGYARIRWADAKSFEHAQNFVRATTY